MNIFEHLVVLGSRARSRMAANTGADTLGAANLPRIPQASRTDGTACPHFNGERS
jgi:hypothetical protein